MPISVISCVTPLSQRYDRELNKVVVWGKETLQALKREEAASKASADELKFRERRRTELDM